MAYVRVCVCVVACRIARMRVCHTYIRLWHTYACVSVLNFIRLCLLLFCVLGIYDCERESERESARARARERERERERETEVENV